MTKRIWDPEGIYIEGFLKEYSHWILEVSFRQHTLGCFIIFAKRSVEKISELEKEEWIELKKVMNEIESALNVNPAFKPDRFNYLQMGNGLHHLHFHGIPRYIAQRRFYNRVWTDKTWGHPPLWNNNDEDTETILQIKNKILDELNK